MADKRNRTIELIEYIESLGIKVNIGKTKARGNNGVFMHRGRNFRIDISKNLSEEKVLSVLMHELAHYIHYKYDKRLKSLDFIFESFNEEYHEELIKITVDSLPKEFALSLYKTKDDLNTEIKKLAKEIKKQYPEYKISERYKPIEKMLKFPFNYLLKYDRIKVFAKVYSIAELAESNLSETVINYVRLKSKQRQVNRINSKISRLNKYYNNYSELFARFMELYFIHPEQAEKIAPNACKVVKNTNIKIIKDIENIMFCETI